MFGFWPLFGASRSLPDENSREDDTDWDVPEPETRRVVFGTHSTGVCSYPSSGGFLVSPHSSGVDLLFLQLSRFDPAERSEDPTAEDQQCARMRMLGAWRFTSTDEYKTTKIFNPENLWGKTTVVAAWPESGVGVWVVVARKNDVSYRQSATELVSICIGASPQDIRISSLACAVDPWERPPTKTATLTFEKGDHITRFNSNNGEWTFMHPALANPLILDSHFRGLTPLNEVAAENHQYDCIAISGLASHPFGSWQPHGRDKSFMWIRDELPQFLPTVRFILYGYDTTLRPSTSFQRVSDLANSFIVVLQADGWTSPTAKPLLFLAHSLGGVILKESLLMLAGAGQQQASIANLVQGAIFFGVPSQGMAIHDIFRMLGDQPNKEALVTEISTESNYLSQLEKQFSGVSFVRTLKMFWAYETKMTPTVASSRNSSSRSGPETVLVTRGSATGGRCYEDPSLTIQIDENHSDIVKFTHGDYRVRIIVDRLAKICGIRPVFDQTGLGIALSSVSTDSRGIPDDRTQSMQNQQLVVNGVENRAWIHDPIVWDNQVILRSLRAPERDLRMQQIDPAATYTFDWVYDDTTIGMSEWLRRGEGIFWISGKPGSGKSTMMKFIHNDQRTTELLHKWNSRARQIMPTFFFHHRGNHIQRSFEGLLRSIISQILEAEEAIFEVIRSAFDEEYLKRVKMNGLGSLQLDILQLTKLCNITESALLAQDIEKIIRSLDLRPSLPRPVHINLEAEINKLLMKYSEQLNTHRRTSDNRRLESGVENHQIIGEEIQEQLSNEVGNGIKNLVKRHESRIDIQSKIQNEEWTKSRLEDILLRICSQTLFDLDLFFLLDALDEYDGRPEFISGFLKDLIQDASFPRTKVRILFSSRHWDVFQKEFETSLGFRIHEHTKGDIRNYCTSSICNNFQTPGCLLLFVEDIVTRSRGVFLWVKLVLCDLFRIMREHNHTKDSAENDLRIALDSMPDELEEYYTAIIERIPLAARWDTYVVLECLARRTGNALTVHELYMIAAYSTAKICPGNDQWQQIQIFQDGSQAEQFVRKVSGGLVDKFPEHISDFATVQLMHQTVKDFIETPQFRHLVLGSNRTSVTVENGHSFLAKYFFLHYGTLDYNTSISINTSRMFSFHAREAERTTGVSQYTFFACTPDVVHFAAFAGLQLYFEDAYKAESRAFANSTRLISSIGLGLGQLFCAMWIGDVRDGPRRRPLGELDEYRSDIASDLVSQLKDTEILIDLDRVSSAENVNLYGFSSGTILHMSPPDIAAKLLERGANPNAQDALGRSPLDYILNNVTVHPPSPGYLHELSLLLIKYGGLLRTTTSTEWNIYIHNLEKNGLGTQVFEDYGFPAWDHTKPKYVQRQNYGTSPRLLDREHDTGPSLRQSSPSRSRRDYRPPQARVRQAATARKRRRRQG
ncbi:hypothetical protein F5Y00DRAFT_268344 [Daldinia vernicosa]|uniref:uncharacterized protein n=1 Tax=Daldinia vernicosa TaxID=114800 RepID=UPI002007B675|nr:uncharacterized protein F5Y00DRAFT_268344 [Daldinia vernicosa]KAI0850599.1 hypothetical protein F5Y00DRAFT_268344 [Daldinia vernicosa]